MPVKKHNPGCSTTGNCCYCITPPTCTFYGIGGHSEGADIWLTWTTSGAVTVSVEDQDGNVLSTEKNGTDFLVEDAACGTTYTLYATNECGTTEISHHNGCADGTCTGCEVDTVPTSFTVQITNGGKLNNCECGSVNATARCNAFNGSFTVSGGVGTCEWTGGTFASAGCRAGWSLRLAIQAGDCDGNDMGSLYAKLTISYPVVDPLSCVEAAPFIKRLGDIDDLLNCASVIPGVYTQCSFLGKTQMCDLSVEIL